MPSPKIAQSFRGIGEASMIQQQGQQQQERRDSGNSDGGKDTICTSAEFSIEDFEQSSEQEQLVERTILTMENDHLCLHPSHGHSFQQVNFMISFNSTCAGCHRKLNPVLFGSGLTGGAASGVSDGSNRVVRCLGCGVLAHRSCAMSSQTTWRDVCPVNAARVSGANGSPPTVEREDEGSSSNEIVFEEVKRPSTLITDGGSFTKISSRDGEEFFNAPSLAEPEKGGSSSSSTIIPSITLPASDDADADDEDDDDDEVHVTPLHYASRPFASISRALQENILAPTRRRGSFGSFLDGSSSADDDYVPSEAEAADTTKGGGGGAADVLARFGRGTYQAAVNGVTESMPGKMGVVATVAGGIAGGVAGMCIAGPAGSMAGAQACGALGVILEGSVSIGVFVASVATGTYSAGKVVQDATVEGGRRVLSMGETGASRRLLLVRPNVKIDPVWDRILSVARSTAPRDPHYTIFLHQDEEVASRDRRYRRFADIVSSGEDEIPTSDKVFLMVNRILNDKNSLPGHVYRYLIQAFLNRCEERVSLLEKNPSVTGLSPRSRRDDAHAVIKLVTATLLEVRPVFASSAKLTETAAVAVESLVFGKLYDRLFVEIVAETTGRDDELREKVGAFAKRRPLFRNDHAISDRALGALRMLPGAHSAADKLRFCVTFLERISEHFSSSSWADVDDGGDDGCDRGGRPGAAPMCADSLLKMVCQHILAADVEHMNAEVAFLEEFARDEQLLRGREGYALVTLQASLHFLNMSGDLERDIFEQDDQEQNVPVVGGGNGNGNGTSNPERSHREAN